MRIGLLGGTFDPVHHGHLVVAQAALEELELDEVRLLVAGDPWMKARTTPAVVRVELCRLAVADNGQLEVDDRECRRDGPTYTFDTLLSLRAEQPEAELFFVVGADAAQNLDRWHRDEDLFGLARFVVVNRPGHDLPDDLPQGVEHLQVPPMDVSSTQLREFAGRGRSLRYLVPEAVRRRIGEYGLYGPDDG